MKKSVKDEWVRRLRSGDYEQGMGELRFEDKYCCLGVLCVMAVEAGVIEETSDPMTGVFAYGRAGSDDDRQTQMLPVSVAEWAGLMGTPAAKLWVTEVRVHADLPYDIPRGDTQGGPKQDLMDLYDDGWIRPGKQDLMELNDDGCSFEQIATVIEVGIEADE
jgi:hypothetical protein